MRRSRDLPCGFDCQMSGLDGAEICSPVPDLTTLYSVHRIFNQASSYLLSLSNISADVRAPRVPSLSRRPAAARAMMYFSSADSRIASWNMRQHCIIRREPETKSMAVEDVLSPVRVPHDNPVKRISKQGSLLEGASCVTYWYPRPSGDEALDEAGTTKNRYPDRHGTRIIGWGRSMRTYM